VTTAIASDEMVKMLDGVSKVVETKKEKTTTPKAKKLATTADATVAADATVETESLYEIHLAELNEQEAIIAKGQDAFFATALAVLAIVQGKLFRVERDGVYFKKQGDYFMTRWSLSDSQVSRYIAAGAVLSHLAKKFTKDEMPKNEGQCRALADVKTEELQAAVWKACVESGEKITAKTIADLAKRIATTGKATVSEEEKAEAVAFDARKTKTEKTLFGLTVKNPDLEEMKNHFGQSVIERTDTKSVFLTITGTRQEAFKRLTGWKRFHEITDMVIKFSVE